MLHSIQEPLPRLRSGLNGTTQWCEFLGRQLALCFSSLWRALALQGTAHRKFGQCFVILSFVFDAEAVPRGFIHDVGQSLRPRVGGLMSICACEDGASISQLLQFRNHNQSTCKTHSSLSIAHHKNMFSYNESLCNTSCALAMGSAPARLGATESGLGGKGALVQWPRPVAFGLLVDDHKRLQRRKSLGKMHFEDNRELSRHSILAYNIAWSSAIKPRSRHRPTLPSSCLFLGGEKPPVTHTKRRKGSACRQTLLLIRLAAGR